jgi:2-polyprenyl-3-methyl-5-hydroxy-6-metoxy-1,4-benzoquinol methylase
MPVRAREHSGNAGQQEPIYQRAQYAKGGIGRRYWDFRDAAVFREIPQRAGAILDAGCGEGITLEKLARLFGDANVTGVDLLEENIDICGKHGLPAARGDLTKLDLSAESVDCCTLIEVIEHIERAETVLRELFRVLKPNGCLIVAYPNDAVFKIARYASLKIREALYDPGHVRQWTPDAMRKTLGDCGFLVKKTTCIPFGLWPISLHGITVAVKPRS